jgi:hypothetical protein
LVISNSPGGDIKEFDIPFGQFRKLAYISSSNYEAEALEHAMVRDLSI